MHRFSSFWRDESGATAVEYALMVALVSVILIVGLTLMSQSLTNVFNRISQVLERAIR